MRLTITSKLVARTAVDGAAVPFSVKVYDDSTEPWVLAVPTTLQYRVDNPETGCVIVDWTTISPASSATITVTGSQETLTGCQYRSRRQLTVRSDAGLSTVAVATHDYWIRNVLGLTA
jgi:hypothetical protein